MRRPLATESTLANHNSAPCPGPQSVTYDPGTADAMPTDGGPNWVVSRSLLVDETVAKKYNYILVLTDGLKTRISACSIETLLGLLKHHVSVILCRNLVFSHFFVGIRWN